MEIAALKNLEYLINKDEDKKKNLDFLGFVPCPIKPKFREAYEELAKAYYEETGDQFFSFVPASCAINTDNAKSLSNVLSIDNIENMPDVMVSPGLSDISNSKVLSRFISKGYYKRVIDINENETFNDLNLKDPWGAFNPIAIYATIILVDKKKIGNLPVPKSWKDLLNPIYKDSIVIPGGHGEVSSLFPMHMYKEQGEEAFAKIDNNVCNVMHGSKIAKIAGSGNSECAPIYVTSWFFAKACANIKDIEIIWPEEGALVEPAVMIVKKDAAEKTERIVDFIKSEKVSKIFADNFFISTYKGIDNKLPGDAKFQWIGWDYVYNNPIEEFKEKVQSIFKKYIK